MIDAILASIAPICGALVDMSDLGQVLAHVPDAEIEISDDMKEAAN